MIAKQLPKHIQISETLIREIMAGLLADGTRLPSEKVMAKDYNVAVGTLRKALTILEGKKLLKRVQGSGNYIQTKSRINSVYSHFKLELIEGAGLPSAQIVILQVTDKPELLPYLGDSKLAHRIVRIRSLGDVQIALEEIWLDIRFAQNLEGDEISESLYLYYKAALNLTISKIEDRLGVSSVPAWKPRQFNMKQGEPAGYVERLSWDQFGEPAEFSRTWFNPQYARYVNRF